MQEFLDNCVAIKRDTDPDYEVEILVVDNSESNQKGTSFSFLMQGACEHRDIKYVHLDVPVDHAAPIHNKIATSANYITEYAKDNGFDYLYILECDVIPGSASLNKLVKYLKDGEYAAVMGSYYTGYSYSKFKSDTDPFFLTGIVLMDMKVFDHVKWRFDHGVIGALPDAFMGHDLKTNGFKVGFHPSVFSLHLSDGQRNPIGRQGSGWQNI